MAKKAFMMPIKDFLKKAELHSYPHFIMCSIIFVKKQIINYFLCKVFIVII